MMQWHFPLCGPPHIKKKKKIQQVLFGVKLLFSGTDAPLPPMGVKESFPFSR